MSEELVDFRKVMEEQIKLKAKPVAKKYGLKPGRKNKFVLEKDGVLFALNFWFWRDLMLHSDFEIMPLCAATKGLFDALPYCEDKKMRDEECILPKAHRSGEIYGKKETPEQAQIREERIIREFDERFRYLESTLHYCNEINTFEEYMNRVQSRLEEMSKYYKREPKIGGPENYILGVYDCMKGNYEEGMIKISKSIAEDLTYMVQEPGELERAKTLSLDEIKWYDVTVLEYKCKKHILEAVENSAPTSRRESFQKAYEEVCQRMRRYYGIKCKK
jgi:hypothetical protein